MNESNDHPADDAPSELTSVPVEETAPVEPAVSDEPLHEGLVPGDSPLAESAPAALDEMPEADEDGMVRMTLGEHLEDLRKRLFYCILGLFLGAVIGLLLGTDLMQWITGPWASAMAGIPGMEKAALNVTQVTGAFSMYLRISLYFGLVLSSPWIFYHLWMFVGAGLYANEKRWVKLAVPASALLFFLGAAFATQVSIPAIKFFVHFGQKLGINPIITLDDYVEFMIKLVLAFGIIFQMPLVVLVLSKVGIATMKRLRHYRRHVVVACAAIAALLAPPDVLSMLAMLLPMWVLYEVGILLSWLLIFRHRPTEDTDETDE